MECLNRLGNNALVYPIEIYTFHSSITKIKSSFEKKKKLFDFNFVSSDDISKFTNSLNPTKKTKGAI